MTAETIVTVPTFSDQRGALSVLTVAEHLPFVVDRVFWIYGVSSGVTRGEHAHRTQHQAVICVHGALEVTCDHGAGLHTHELRDPHQVLILPPMTFASERPLSNETVWLVLAEGAYDRRDYLESYAAWRAAR